MTSHPHLHESVPLLALKSHILGTPSVLGKVRCFVTLPPRFCSLTDTGAMAVLALTCVKRRIINEKIETDEEDLNRINNHTELLVKRILSEKKENGLIGNTFSTGEAMQVSQRIKQEIEKGVVEESSIFILSYWPPKILSSVLCLFYRRFHSHNSFPLCEMYSLHLQPLPSHIQCFYEVSPNYNLLKKF